MTQKQRDDFGRRMSDIGAAREVELPLEQPKERMFLDLTQWIITGLLVIGGLVLSWFLLPWLLELVPPGRQRFYAFVLYFAFVRIMVAVVMTRSFRKR